MLCFVRYHPQHSLSASVQLPHLYDQLPDPHKLLHPLCPYTKLPASRLIGLAEDGHTDGCRICQGCFPDDSPIQGMLPGLTPSAEAALVKLGLAAVPQLQGLARGSRQKAAQALTRALGDATAADQCLQVGPSQYLARAFDAILSR